MDTSTLIAAYHVLSLGNVREAARILGRPPATVSDALSRLQTQLAVPLTTRAGSRLMPTLEGRRVKHQLKLAADLVERLAGLGGRTAATMPALSMLALSRLVVIGRTGSIRAAASELGMGQPQLTRQVNALEEQIGIRLLERAVSGVTFTGEGNQALDASQELCRLWQHLCEQSDERFRHAARRVRFGVVTPLGWESQIAVDLAMLAADWPRLQPRTALYISSNNADELLTGLDRRQHDLVLLDTDEIPALLDHHVLSRSPLALVGSPNLVRSCDGDIRKLLLNGRLALPSLKSGLRQRFTLLVDDILQPNERAGLIVTEIDSIPVIANLVVRHDYLSLLPLSAIRGMNERIAALRLPSVYDMPLVLAWRREPALYESAMLVANLLGQGATSRNADLADYIGGHLIS
ncbi:LysR family transcriptional regulator [Neorhizobium sp. NCHU2750]|uniref:LysR family transcriptional regulator n=1 Tax=Neorhizobium sp. NCHU2750 TaxID=1825976 RepID=UPI000EB6A48A|nr:hypothetical protein NCHU2750_47680 [Neorhizobium sp. NCHU2750]